MPGKLVILNGGSSAGKSSLGRAMQDLLPECYMLLGIDTFWLALPPEQLNLSHVRAEYYSWRSETGPDGREYFVIQPGPILDQAMLRKKFEDAPLFRSTGVPDVGKLTSLGR